MNTTSRYRTIMNKLVVESYLFPPNENACNGFPRAAACHAAATDPATGGGFGLRPAYVEDPGPLGRMGWLRRGCPNYLN